MEEGEEGEYQEHFNEETIEEHQRQFDNTHEAQHSDAHAEREAELAEENLPQNVSELGPRHSMHEPEQTVTQSQNPTSFAAATSNTDKPSMMQRAPSITAGMRIDTSVNISSPPPNRSASPGPLQQQHSGTSQSVPFASPRPPSGRNSPLLRSSSRQESPPPPLAREFSSSSSTGGRNPPMAPQNSTPELAPRPSSPASSTATATSPAARPFSMPVSALRSVSSFRSSLSQRPSFWKANSPPARSNSVASMRDMAASGKGLNVASPTDTSPGSSKGGAMVDMINTKEYFILSSMQAKTPAEIAEMKRDLDFCLKELQVASKRIESLEFHNAHLTEDVSLQFPLFISPCLLLNRFV